MHIFPALISNLQCDVTYDKEVLRDWDFPFIHRTVDSDNGCLEANIRMVYCVAFDCNANSSKNRVICSWYKFPVEPTLLKKANFKPKKHDQLCSLRENSFGLFQNREGGSPGLS